MGRRSWSDHDNWLIRRSITRLEGELAAATWIQGRDALLNDAVPEAGAPIGFEMPTSHSWSGAKRLLRPKGFYFGVDSRHSKRVTEEPTLATKLGMTTHLSPLLRKARRLGMGPSELEALAVQRGGRHYSNGTEPEQPLASEREFSNEELALALLSIALRYEPHSIRCGAAMLSAAGNDPRWLARMAVMERSVVPVRYVSEAGRRFEPENQFWIELLAALPKSPPPRTGVLPHPTRFITMTGLTRQGPGLVTEWQRPRVAKTGVAA